LGPHFRYRWQLLHTRTHTDSWSPRVRGSWGPCNRGGSRPLHGNSWGSPPQACQGFQGCTCGCTRWGAPAFRRVCVTCPDGGVVALDWPLEVDSWLRGDAGGTAGEGMGTGQQGEEKSQGLVVVIVDGSGLGLTGMDSVEAHSESVARQGRGTRPGPLTCSHCAIHSWRTATRLWCSTHGAVEEGP